MTEDQPDEIKDETQKTLPESPKMITLSEDQFNQIMTQMQSLNQQIDFLKNQVETSKEAQQTREAPSEEAQEAVMHTLSRMKSGRDMISTQKKQSANELVELAIDYALADYAKNPPKNRRPE